ncbi:hypothetical protein FYJ24_07125 [Actinomycetaceae bacterium WB03_NA08]|uniref:YbaK/aminoacyl-tRNA synthetase-associated domain-containing protein n=1 Tax=Scrofimicrobium canadense TaxID=2652290 RepID=A0A6N7W8S2_9ACTO|nr:YbaK/EbsC family protein [Scrofimicrobium canadense]MSS84538.1 hypothetical protein [Scrofimicrobium canadense]
MLDIPGVGNLELVPVSKRLDLVAPVVEKALKSLEEEHSGLLAEVFVAEIDPSIADTDVMTATLGTSLELSVNCILVSGKRAGEERVAACAVRATTRADVNHVVKATLDVRKASFMSQDIAVERSGMEYGGITPIGLPENWRILLDSRTAEGWACIGSGLRKSKLVVSANVLKALPGAEVVESLAIPIH